MGEVTLIPVFEIKPGRTEDFKAAAAAIIERVNGEPGTIGYTQYLSPDGRRAVNIEVFRDADAFVHHNRNCADLVPPLVDAGPIVHIEAIGEPNDDMRAELAGVQVHYLAELGRIDR